MVLAVVLFAASTVLIIEAMQRSQAGAAGGEYALLATHGAQECLEALRNQSYGALTVGSGVMSSVTGCGSSLSALPSGSRSVTISQPYSNLKQVTVTVSWSAQGGTANASLQTYRAGA